MKQFLFLLIIYATYSDQRAAEEKVIGTWTVIEIMTTEKMPNDIYEQRTFGLIEPIKISFKPNFIATATKNNGELISDLDWKINMKKIEIHYNGEDLFLNEFNDKFGMKFSGKRKLKLVSENNKTIFLERD